MANYRDPSNYSFSYKKDVDSIEGIDDRVTKIEEDGGGGGGTTDYNDLKNKPQINSVELSGDKTSEDLKIHKPVVKGETIIFS